MIKISDFYDIISLYSLFFCYLILKQLLGVVYSPKIVIFDTSVYSRLLRTEWDCQNTSGTEVLKVLTSDNAACEK